MPLSASTAVAIDSAVVDMPGATAAADGIDDDDSVIANRGAATRWRSA